MPTVPGQLPLPPGVEPGERATLVQFSSAFCMPCRATRTVLGRAVDGEPGVRVVELEVAQHLATAERLGVRETPTVVLLDRDGRIRATRTGVPRLAQVRALLEDL